jgi:hypothetical protein
MKVNLEKCVCGIQGETDNWPWPLTSNTRSNLFLNSCLIKCSFSQELQASLQSTKYFSWHVWWLLEIGLHPDLLSTWRPHTKLPNTVRDLWEHTAWQPHLKEWTMRRKETYADISHLGLRDILLPGRRSHDEWWGYLVTISPSSENLFGMQ